METGSTTTASASRKDSNSIHHRMCCRKKRRPDGRPLHKRRAQWFVTTIVMALGRPNVTTDVEDALAAKILPSLLCGEKLSTTR